MKQVLLPLFFSGMVFAPSCRFQTKAAETEPDPVFRANDANDKSVKKIYGEWLVVNVQVEASDRQTELEVEDELAVYKEDMELNPIAFEANGRMISGPTSYNNKLYETFWQFMPPNLIGMGDGTPSSFYEILKLRKDSMLLYAELPAAKNTNGRVRILNTLHRINSQKIAGTDIFADSINWWRIQPVHAETREQIVERLKSMLRYNYVYVRCLYYSQATYINTRKLNMPFIYYNGGIGLKTELDARDTFMDYFYSKEDVATALNILKEAMSKVEYARKSNYVLEYAAFMNDMANILQ